MKFTQCSWKGCSKQSYTKAMQESFTANPTEADSKADERCLALYCHVTHMVFTLSFTFVLTRLLSMRGKVGMHETLWQSWNLNYQSLLGSYLLKDWDFIDWLHNRRCAKASHKRKYYRFYPVKCKPTSDDSKSWRITTITPESVLTELNENGGEKRCCYWDISSLSEFCVWVSGIKTYKQHRRRQNCVLTLRLLGQKYLLTIYTEDKFKDLRRKGLLER